MIYDRRSGNKAYKGLVPLEFIRLTMEENRTESFEIAAAWWLNNGMPQKQEKTRGGRSKNSNCKYVSTSISGISPEIFEKIKAADNGLKPDVQWRIREICFWWAESQVQEATQ